MKRFFLVAVFAFDCGLDAKAPVSAASSTQALTCGSEPADDGNGIVTATGCSFEQQWQNISAHGTMLPSPAAITGAGSPLGVTATQQCGSWIMGTDAQGVTVFLNTTSGEVRSHGSLHAGYATSTLPSSVALPIETH